MPERAANPRFCKAEGAALGARHPLGPAARRAHSGEYRGIIPEPRLTVAPAAPSCPAKGRPGRRSKENPINPEELIPFCSQMVAQAFQPVLTQAKACGYQKQPFECNSALIWQVYRPRIIL
jgi:hypothetical protein